MEKTVEEAYKILTQRRVRRAWPKSSQEVKSCIKNSLNFNQPLILTVEWLGVKTVGSGAADNADRMAIFFLEQNIVKKLLKAGIKKIIVKILFADTNASYVDGYSRERINLYWKTLEKIICSFGKNFRLVRTSKEFYPKIFKLDGNEKINLKEIAKKVKAVDFFEKAKKKTNTICKNHYFKTINLLSKKHSLLVRNKALTTEKVSKRYIFLRVFTSMLYKKRYPNEIFLSYTYPEINNLILFQPVVYVFSICKGCSKCPWFISDKIKD